MMSSYQNGYVNKCPICGKDGINILYNSVMDKLYYYNCPVCGMFFAPNEVLFFKQSVQLEQYDNIKLRSYLFYNPTNIRAVLVNRDDYEKYITDEFVDVYNLTPEMVENWYPKNFNEKIDKILLWIADKSRYMGEEVVVSIEDLCVLFFMFNKLNVSSVSHEWCNEFRFVIKYLIQNEFIGGHSVEHLKTLTQSVILQQKITLILTEKAWQKIYDLQKNQSNNKNVFIAMKFGEETHALREKLKEGLEGYNVRIMDEIEHNHQIVPEMLYEIRNSKFVIAELSNHNNGAYYEAGYALGLGKEVIHVCKKSEVSDGLHFDVSQVNTIVYDSIDEIPMKLKKRIQATIK